MRQGPGDTADWPAELQLSASPFDNRLGQQLAIGDDSARAPQRIWLPNGEILGAALNWRWPQGQRAMPAVLADPRVAAYGAAYGLQSTALAGAGAVP